MSAYPLLSVEEKRRLAVMVRAWRDALLVGNPAPAVKRALKRSEDIQPGDCVVETSTLSYLLADTVPEEKAKVWWDGQFTRYLRTEIQTNAYPCDEGDEEEETWDEKVYVCENPDGTEFRWTNANLIAVPVVFVDPTDPLELGGPGLTTTDPTPAPCHAPVLLSLASLCSKSGFYDGDLLSDILGDHGVPIGKDAEHELLISLVRTRLLPAIAKAGHQVEVYEIGTIHNPIRASTLDGVPVDDLTQYEDLPAVYVYVSCADVLAEAVPGTEIPARAVRRGQEDSPPDHFG